MSDMETLNNNEANMEEFRKLQKRLNHESIRHQFRTKLVGGLNEEDVTQYIEALEEKFKNLELENKKATDEVYALRIKLNSELEEKDSLLNNLEDLKQDLNSYMSECTLKDTAISSIKEKGSVENVLLKSEIQQLTEQKQNLSESLNASYIEIDRVKEQLTGIENENFNVKSMLSSSEEKNSQLELEKTSLVQEINRFEQESIKLQNENTVLLKAKEEMQYKLNSMNNELADLRNASSRLEQENIALTAKIAELTEENMKIEVLQNEINSKTEEHRAAVALLNQSTLECDTLKKNIELMEVESSYAIEKAAELENTLSSKELQISEINRVCMDLKHQNEIDKATSEKLNMDLVLFKQKMASLQETISANLEELEEQKKKTENVELELNMERAKLLSYKINGFKEEFNDIYKKMETLEYEANHYLKSSTILQQQLAKEQNRADKAESDLESFMKMLTGMKDKFNSERNNLGEEFAQLVERQIQKQPEIRKIK